MKIISTNKNIYKQAGPRRIKDRGIIWKERYHERSQRLKDRFEKDLGPISYMRWEGHDYTTDSDYFVVVGPAVTQDLKKRFFAGVKKLPKDPRAKVYAPSGEYFSTLSGALSHASEKWAIPYPRNAPHYTLNDLANIKIPRHVKGNLDMKIIKTAKYVKKAEGENLIYPPNDRLFLQQLIDWRGGQMPVLSHIATNWFGRKPVSVDDVEDAIYALKEIIAKAHASRTSADPDIINAKELQRKLEEAVDDSGITDIDNHDTVDLLARYIGDGALVAAAKADNPAAYSERFWAEYYSEGYDEDAADTVALSNVPLELARKFLAQGTSAQEFSDGYEAAQAAIPYLNKG